MNFELLGSQEADLEQFKSAYWEAFKLVPDLENMRPMVARDEKGEIVGFFCLYTVVVADSMWIRKDYRRTGLWKRLVEAINRLPWGVDKGYYFFEEKRKQGKIAEMFQDSKSGKLPVAVWRKVF